MIFAIPEIEFEFMCDKINAFEWDVNLIIKFDGNQTMQSKIGHIFIDI